MSQGEKIVGSCWGKEMEEARGGIKGRGRWRREREKRCRHEEDSGKGRWRRPEEREKR